MDLDDTTHWKKLAIQNDLPGFRVQDFGFETSAFSTSVHSPLIIDSSSTFKEPSSFKGPEESVRQAVHILESLRIGLGFEEQPTCNAWRPAVQVAADDEGLVAELVALVAGKGVVQVALPSEPANNVVS